MRKDVSLSKFQHIIKDEQTKRGTFLSLISTDMNTHDWEKTSSDDIRSTILDLQTILEKRDRIEEQTYLFESFKDMADPEEYKDEENRNDASGWRYGTLVYPSPSTMAFFSSFEIVSKTEEEYDYLRSVSCELINDHGISVVFNQYGPAKYPTQKLFICGTDVMKNCEIDPKRCLVAATKISATVKILTDPYQLHMLLNFYAKTVLSRYSGF